MNGVDSWGNPGDMGIPVLWDFSSSTGKVSGSAGDYRKQAQSQVDAAKAGQQLAGMRAETHPNWTYTGASNDVGAMYRVGYWLAVGSRVLLARGQSPSKLLVPAEEAVNKGYSRSIVPFMSDPDPRKIQRIMLGGAEMANQAGLPDIARVLGATGTTASTAERQERASETSLGPSLAQQGTKVLQTGAGLITGEKPDGMSDWAWFWKKWGVRLAIGAGVVIIGAIVLRPYLGAARGAIGAISGPRTNPKKGTIPWWLVGGVTALAAADTITPGFPFPGSAALMIPLAGATWIAKLAEYGVTK